MNEKLCIRKRVIWLGILGLMLIIMVFFMQSLSYIKTIYKSNASESKDEVNIVGGTEVTDPTKWPFIVRITVPVPLLLDHTYCDGTLIAPRWILTAGHCITDFFNDKVVSEWGVTVSSGSNDLSNRVKKYKVESIYRHPHFIKRDKHYLNDIALLYLTEDIKGIDTISINGDSNLEQDGRMSVLIGWGKTDYTKFPFLLNQAVVPVLSNRRVNKKDWENEVVEPSEIGAGYPLGGVDACDGDSGGPLMVWNDTKWIQIGIVSWKSDWCGKPKHPGINTRISYSGLVQGANVNYKQWIMDTVNLKSNKLYIGEGTFYGNDLTMDEKKQFNTRIWFKCEMQQDDGQPC